MSIRTAPCSWPVDPSAICGDDWAASLTPDLSALVLDTAVEWLWGWTGRRFGLCAVTVRPCRVDCPGAMSTWRGRSGGDPFLPSFGAFTPALVGGVWRNIGCGTCADVCSCTDLQVLRLPGPIDSVELVDIGGVTLDPGDYRVDRSTDLVRTDGGLWPTCQDMAAPSGAPGTWTVTYTYGIPVPAGGQIAAAALACELAKSLRGDECRLPRRVQTITRQGVTMALLDPFDGLDSGRSGLWEVDSWVSSVTKPPGRSTVRSPDVPRLRRTTWP